MTIRLLGFDLDDTLWVSKPVLVRAEKELQRWISLIHPSIAQHCSIEQFLALRAELNDASKLRAEQITSLRMQSLMKAAEISGYSRDDALVFTARAMEMFLFWRSEFSVTSDVINALKTLSEDYHLVAISNGNANLKNTALAAFFTMHLTAESFGCAKPKPDMLNHAANAFGAKADECVYIGDSEIYDRPAADAAGWVFCKIANSSDADIRSISELSRWLVRWDDSRS